MKLTSCCRAAVLACALAAAAAAQEVRSGPWNSRRPPEGWVVHKSRFYEIQSEAGMEKAERLGEHMDTLYEVYTRTFPSDKGGVKRYTIKLFKDRASFRDYGAPAGAGAYYSFTDREMVCYDTGRWMDEPTDEPGEPATGPRNASERMARYRRSLERYRMDILGAASHEGWHQYFHWYVTSLVELPSWINEGMGDYFYCARPKKVRGRKVPADLGAPNLMRLPTIWAAVKQGEHIPLEDFLHYDKRAYYQNGPVCYAQGWALCQFLMHHDKRRYRQVVPRFIRLVRDDTNMADVTAKAFRGIDLADLDAEFREWVLDDGLAMLREATGKAPGGK